MSATISTATAALAALLSVSTARSLLDPLRHCRIVSSLSEIPNEIVASASTTLIGTHDGSFHCDEALAISMLSLLPVYRPTATNTFIIRTRNPEILERCNLVVDVGAQYDPSKHLYDHHQRSFTECMGSEFTITKLSSAGLIFKHFGKDVIRTILSECSTGTDEVTDEIVQVFYRKLYKDFMQHVDAIDNGVSICVGEPNYHISTSLSSRVGHLNAAWNEPNSSADNNARFLNAILLTGGEFVNHAESLWKSWWPARALVQQALQSRLQIDDSGKIICFSQACPWKEHLFELEAEMGITGSILYALYPDQGGSWRIQAVPVNPTSFDSRKKLPSEWCGFRDGELSEKSGVPGSIFIHASGFIGGHADKEGAFALAKKALLL